jgi:ATP-dependent HslUV protease ATP-binding subunit HslU
MGQPEKPNLTPRQIVEELDRYIVGQDAAKRAVAIAMRNRYRRRQLSEELRAEVSPKNILMIGPTGVGKTEIARRLAAMANAPFLKVEATKYTEVGYVGRDVESMVRDLMEASIRLVEQRKLVEVEDRAAILAEERLLELLQPSPKRAPEGAGLLSGLFGGGPPQAAEGQPPADEGHFQEQEERVQRIREQLRGKLEAGQLEDHEVELEIEAGSSPMIEIFSPHGSEQMGVDMQDLFGSMMPKRTRKRRVTIAEARELLKRQEAEKLIDRDAVIREALDSAENDGIIFLDELDKVAGREGVQGPDVSREGVQRDILPIVEGSTVNTKYGPVNTQHVLFIAAGAFNVSKPSDLIPELQGRFPIRVELASLSADDFKRILTEPENSLVRQYTELLATEGLEVLFGEDAVEELAQVAQKVNDQTENIGARRLHTVIEKLLEEASFYAPELSGQQLVVDRAFVKQRLADLAENADLSRYIL